MSQQHTSLHVSTVVTAGKCKSYKIKKYLLVFYFSYLNKKRFKEKKNNGMQNGAFKYVSTLSSYKTHERD